MPKDITKKVISAIEARDLSTLLAVLEEADRVLTGDCQFAQGAYWRQFVEVDFQRFFALLDEKKDAINAVKLGDGVSKMYVRCVNGEVSISIQCPDEVGNRYEEIWEKIK